ncbi:MAG: glycosyltransferase [Deltaproteobacteria bacterium]|nr:glycosyltransferase [Deltaproteobacteria bacterium]
MSLAGSTPETEAAPPAGGRDAVRRRRVLVIVRDYPPANTPAAQRALGFARYLPEFGWEASVVTLRAAARGGGDAGPPAPAARAVYPAFGFDTKDVFSLRGRYPHLLAVPDRNVSWLPDGVVQALRAVRRERVDVLLSTGPPQTAHCIAHLVQRLAGLPWVADVRDLWDGPPPHARLAHAVEHRLARRLLRACDRLTAVTAGIADGLQRAYAVELAQKTDVLPNGFDEQAFAGVEPRASSGGRFTIAHIGWAASGYRHPGPVLQGLRAGLDRGDLPADTVMSFLGAHAGIVQSVSRALQLQDVVQLRARVPYDEALRAMCSASVLLLLQGDEFRHAVPAKAYEYLRSGRPIVALVTPDGETARLLRQFAGVFLASPERPDEAAAALQAAYRAWRDGVGFERPASQLARLTRRAGAGALAAILDRAYAPAAGARRGRG